MYIVIGLLVALVVYSWWSQREGLESQNPGDAAERQRGDILFYTNRLKEIKLTEEAVDKLSAAVTATETKAAELESAVTKKENAERVEKQMGYKE